MARKKNYDFDAYEIQNQFRSFMIQNGIVPFDSELYFTPDGLIHRFRTQDDSNGETSGAYCLYARDWPAGWCQDWRKGASISWSFPKDALNQEGQSFFTKKRYEEALEASRKHQQELLLQHQIIQTQASENARIHFEHAEPANPGHPYLKAKNVPALGLHEFDGKLVVPLRDVNGRFLSLQWIDPEGT